MNPCPKYEESIILHAYQELGRKKVITLKKHLSRCGMCRTYLNELNHVFRIIKTHPEFSSNLVLDIEW
jgi:cytidine deaminase